VLDKAKRGKALSRRQHRKNRMLASIRAKVEHPFRPLGSGLSIDSAEKVPFQESGKNISLTDAL
jgi:hypothetical protein